MSDFERLMQKKADSLARGLKQSGNFKYRHLSDNEELFLVKEDSFNVFEIEDVSKEAVKQALNYYIETNYLHSEPRNKEHLFDFLNKLKNIYQKEDSVEFVDLLTNQIKNMTCEEEFAEYLLNIKSIKALISHQGTFKGIVRDALSYFNQDKIEALTSENDAIRHEALIIKQLREQPKSETDISDLLLSQSNLSFDLCMLMENATITVSMDKITNAELFEMNCFFKKLDNLKENSKLYEKIANAITDNLLNNDRQYEYAALAQLSTHLNEDNLQRLREAEFFWKNAPHEISIKNLHNHIHAYKEEKNILQNDFSREEKLAALTGFYHLPNKEPNFGIGYYPLQYVSEERLQQLPDHIKDLAVENDTVNMAVIGFDNFSKERLMEFVDKYTDSISRMFILRHELGSELKEKVNSFLETFAQDKDLCKKLLEYEPHKNINIINHFCPHRELNYDVIVKNISSDKKDNSMDNLIKVFVLNDDNKVHNHFKKYLKNNKQNIRNLKFKSLSETEQLVANEIIAIFKQQNSYKP